MAVPAGLWHRCWSRAAAKAEPKAERKHLGNRELKDGTSPGHSFGGISMAPILASTCVCGIWTTQTFGFRSARACAAALPTSVCGEIKAEVVAWPSAASASGAPSWLPSGAGSGLLHQVSARCWPVNLPVSELDSPL